VLVGTESFDEWLHLSRGQVEARVSGSLRCGKTNEELSIGIGTLLNDLHPVIEVEVALLIDPVGSRATLGVVPLNPDEIKGRLGDSVAKLLVWNGALGSTRDIEFLLGGSEMDTQTVDHGSIS
jgi:hypothetical protein